MIFGTYNPGEAAQVLMRPREVAAVAARVKAGGEVRGKVGVPNRGAAPKPFGERTGFTVSRT